MKNLILLVGCMSIASLSLAQKYYPQPELKKFAGTWEFTQNNKTFKIIPKVEVKNVPKLGMAFDVIQGQYRYILNDKIVCNSKDSIKSGITHGRLYNKEESLTKLRFTFHDLKKVSMVSVYSS